MNQKNKLSGVELIINPLWEEAALWRCRKTDSGKSRQLLFTKHLPFAKRVAADQYHRRRSDNFELADLEQWALEALLVAVDRYDPFRRVPFTAYARPRILGNISDGVASMSEVTRQSRHYYQVEKERLQALKSESVESGMDPVEVLRKLTVGLALGLMLEGTRLYVDDHMTSDVPNGYESLVWKNVVRKLDREVDLLPPPQPFIIRQHYQNGISFKQIADLLNLSKGRVSQLHHKALNLLRARIGKA